MAAVTHDHKAADIRHSVDEVRHDVAKDRHDHKAADIRHGVDEVKLI